MVDRKGLVLGMQCDSQLGAVFMDSYLLHQLILNKDDDIIFDCSDTFFSASRTRTSSVILFVSLYAPTLSSIIRVRASLSDLVSTVKVELQVLKKLFGENALIKDQEEAKPDPIILHNHTWLHFACHGFLNVTHPLKSFFKLSSRNLTLKEIVNDGCISQRGELAFLATCHSAANEMDGAPDEVISLTGVMMQGSLRFYGHLLEKGVGNADVKLSAMALHLATNAMREGIPAERWCTFIHLGI
ncbi:hypothetical protein D9758_005622 [Tetrapyrgos nigripes]|uniref:CHAT domain-containing protein n=1 Tax=Tetrapyrgos nigripes TaxID=182062 RepID=A0A8H5GH69_9AGAR|nr:hypothetical protein D9758_005622 [Tetrapyrgos nigripes]